MEKSNFGIRVDLLKMKNAFMRNIVGKTSTKRCIVIPIDDNKEMFLSEKGCYLNLSAYAVSNSQYGDTHLIKGDLPKEVREAMTQEERNALPIYGNMRPIKAQTMAVTESVDMGNDGQGDLPF